MLSPTQKPEPQQPPPPAKAVTKSFPHPRKGHGSPLHAAQGTSTSACLLQPSWFCCIVPGVLQPAPNPSFNSKSSLPYRGTGRWERGLWSVHHVVSISSSGMKPFPCSNMGSLTWKTVPHKLLQHESFPQVAVLQELLQRGSFPEAFRNRLLLHGSPAGSQVLSVNLLHHRFHSPWVHESCQDFFQVSTCSDMGLSMYCKWVSAPLCTSESQFWHL